MARIESSHAGEVLADGAEVVLLCSGSDRLVAGVAGRASVPIRTLFCQQREGARDLSGRRHRRCSRLPSPCGRQQCSYERLRSGPLLLQSGDHLRSQGINNPRLLLSIRLVKIGEKRRLRKVP
jgi:hypothetical protein